MPEVNELRPRAHPPQDLERLCGAAGLGLRHRAAAPIDGVTLDSRQVRPGDLYAALPGARTHGARFAARAVAAGAVAVLTDPDGVALLDELPPGVGLGLATDVRAATARAAAALYQHPARGLTTMAVTGTNGKTTTTVMLAAALAALGRVPATVGTLGFTLGGRPLAGERTTVTTPEAPDLQALLAAFAAGGADAVAMEVSSHALVLGRTEPVVFDVAGFTNLGSDHLDFHPDQASYLDAKASLFTPEHATRGVVCLDSAAGAEVLARARAAGLDVTGCGLSDGAGRAEHRAVDLVPDGAGTRFRLLTPTTSHQVRLGLAGEYNVSNAVLALAMLDRLGLDVAAAAAGLAAVVVPGRMQPVPVARGWPSVVVDFAHTPQAVAATLGALRRHLQPAAGGGPEGRLLAVLGCGGDRDPGKRAPMGEAAARAADVVVVTDDNPRTEDPARIRAAALVGARGVAGAEVVDGGEREQAVRTALAMAGPDDLVAVLGKGHETGQEVDGVVRPFDDVEVVTRLTRQPREGGSGAGSQA